MVLLRGVGGWQRRKEGGSHMKENGHFRFDEVRTVRSADFIASCMYDMIYLLCVFFFVFEPCQTEINVVGLSQDCGKC